MSEELQFAKDWTYHSTALTVDFKKDAPRSFDAATAKAIREQAAERGVTESKGSANGNNRTPATGASGDPGAT